MARRDHHSIRSVHPPLPAAPTVPGAEVTIGQMVHYQMGDEAIRRPAIVVAIQDGGLNLHILLDGDNDDGYAGGPSPAETRSGWMYRAGVLEGAVAGTWCRSTAQ